MVLFLSQKLSPAKHFLTIPPTDGKMQLSSLSVKKKKVIEAFCSECTELEYSFHFMKYVWYQKQKEWLCKHELIMTESFCKPAAVIKPVLFQNPPRADVT